MKQYEKEIIQLQLNHEKDVLKELKEMYEEAEKQIDDKIQQLMADEQTQSKIYQLEYQKAIKGQIATILDNMNSHNYDYISDYLKQCYEDGYLSTMYSLHKQGIPLILPIDQEMVVKAIQLDTKLSKPLYEAMGVNVNDLKKAIRQEVSRGISNGYSYRDIARNIRNQMNIGLNKSIRIARTEGHRVNQESTMDGIYAAKEKGADIVKQWDATLDKKTRPSHQRVDGEIREIDERFSNGLMFPGDPEGSAGEVINCRCVLLQRARWAIDDETGNTKWDNENRKLLPIDSKNYQDFKNNYYEELNSMSRQDSNEIVFNVFADTNAVSNGQDKENSDKIKLDKKNFPDVFTNTSDEIGNTERFIDYVNSLPNADQKVLNLYQNLEKLNTFSANGITFRLSHDNRNSLTLKYSKKTGKIKEVTLTIPKLSGDNLAGQINSDLHEKMHLIDLLLRDDPTVRGDCFAASYKDLIDIVNKSTGEIGDDIAILFKKHGTEYQTLLKTLKEKYSDTVDDLTIKYKSKVIDYESYKKAINEARKDILESELNYEARNIMGGGIGNLEDIYDALSGGTLRADGTVLYGHGKSYYSSTSSKINEIIANYAALSVTRPDLIDMLKKDKPELVKELENVIMEMNKKVNAK